LTSRNISNFCAAYGDDSGGFADGLGTGVTGGASIDTGAAIGTGADEDGGGAGVAAPLLVPVLLLAKISSINNYQLSIRIPTVSNGIIYNSLRRAVFQ